MNQDLLIFYLRIGMIALLYVFLAQIVLLVLRDLRKSGSKVATAQARDALIILDANAAGLVAGNAIPLESANTLGRAPSNSLRLVDDFVSSQHATLDYKQKAWWIEDMGSTNGTYVNGKPINRPTKVAEGDEIQIGTSKFRLGKK